jgi:peptidoglycan/LPS O-acetylase OafA/YrhL
MPVLYWLLTRGRFPHAPLEACLAVLLPSVALGALSWIIVERPALRLVSASRLRRRRAGEPRRPLSLTAS